jgi:putative membrane protein
MELLVRLLIMAVIVLVTAALLPGATVKNFWTSLLVAIVIALLNTFLLPIMVFITLPVTIVTFGLFLFILNAFIIWLSSKIISGFHIRNFWWALAFALIISIIHSVFGISGAQFKLN